MAAMLAPVVQKMNSAIYQATVVQTLDSTMHWINHYPADKYWENQVRYPVDKDLSTYEQLGPGANLLLDLIYYNTDPKSLSFVFSF